MEIGEGSAKVAEPEEPAPTEKKTIKIRCCLFFDGTLNNRININQRLLASSDSQLTIEETRAASRLREQATKEEVAEAKELYQEHGAKSSDEENSYEGWYTNVEKLETYLNAKHGQLPGYDYSFKIYIEGIGTLDKGADNLWGYAFGAWKTGIPVKVAAGMQKIMEQIHKEDKIKPDKIITEFALDVFGFSRGAAAARNFIYEALNDDQGCKRSHSLKTRLKHVMLEAQEVKVKFAGLFDTVSTYGSRVVGKVKIAVGSADNVEELSLDAIAQAEKVLHLTAADEHRFHFSLTDIQSAINKGVGREYCLPGVHSDIGGGYREFGDDMLTLRGSTDLKGLILHGNYDSPEKVATDRQQLIDAGWYREDELTFNVIQGVEQESGEPTASYGQLTTTKNKGRRVKGYYSKIPLNIMAREMRGEGFTFISEMARDEKVPDTEPLLNKVQQKLESHATGASKPDPDTWRANMEGWIKSLRHGYLHFSARMQPGHDPRIENGRREREKYPG